MGRNDNRVAAIRKATFGRQTREPICKSLEKTLAADNTKLDEIIEDIKYRIINAKTSNLPEENYFMLVLTRANGT